MEALIPIPWYRRWGWFVYMIVALLVVVFGLFLLTSPVDASDFNRETDLDWAEFSSEAPEVASYLEREGRLLGATAFGLGALAAGLAGTLVRKGDRTAWWLLWFLPVSLVFYALVFVASGAALLAVFYLVVTAIAAAATWFARPLA